jgi:hypothetical protein
VAVCPFNCHMAQSQVVRGVSPRCCTTSFQTSQHALGTTHETIPKLALYLKLNTLHDRRLSRNNMHNDTIPSLPCALFIINYILSYFERG